MRLCRCQSWLSSAEEKKKKIWCPSLNEPNVTGPMVFIGKYICVSSTFKLRDSSSVNEKSADRMWEDIKSALKSQACGTPHLTASTTKSSVSCDLEGATALPGLWGRNVGILLLSGLQVLVYVQKDRKSVV